MFGGPANKRQKKKKDLNAQEIKKPHGCKM